MEVDYNSILILIKFKVIADIELKKRIKGKNWG